MDKFIKYLEQKFNIDLIESNERLPWKSSYSKCQDGHIKRLFLYGIELPSLNVLHPISDQLSELWLQDCGIENLKEIVVFDNLKKLCLDSNPIDLSSFHYIGHLANLNELKLEETTIRDTSIFSSLSSLEVLHLGYCKGLKEVKGLQGLSTLKHLDLECSEITSIENIMVSSEIQSLNLRNSGIRKISGLSQYKGLRNLELPGNPINKLEGLGELKELKRLIVSSAMISEIEGVDNLSKLEVLDLSNNIYGGLSKIAGLDSLENLKQLNLNENLITKVEGLDGLVNIEYMLLECNRIVDFDTTFLRHLNNCFISLVGNPIKSINNALLPNNVTIKFEEENWMPKGL